MNYTTMRAYIMVTDMYLTGMIDADTFNAEVTRISKTY